MPLWRAGFISREAETSDDVRVAIRNLEPVAVVKDQGFVDLVIGITEIRANDRGDFRFTAAGTHAGQEIGFSVVVLGGMRPGFVGEELDRTAIYPSGIVFESDGAKSDRWLRLIAELWGVPQDAKRTMAQRAPAVSVATDGDPRKLQSEKLRFKLFFGPTAQAAECFLHLDYENGSIAVAEKAFDHRAGLVAQLAAPTQK